jgi:hypothetical protein
MKGWFSAKVLLPQPASERRGIAAKRMELNAIVIVNLRTPTERFFGRLMNLNHSGVTVRGVDLNAFEDWITNMREGEESGVRPSTIHHFLPPSSR